MDRSFNFEDSVYEALTGNKAYFDLDMENENYFHRQPSLLNGSFQFEEFEHQNRNPLDEYDERSHGSNYHDIEIDDPFRYKNEFENNCDNGFSREEKDCFSKKEGHTDNSNSQNNKQTANTSKESEKIEPTLISFNVEKSQSKKREKRIDYHLKYFKSKFSKFLTNYGKKMISKINLLEDLKALKLHLPNYKSFTGNPTEKDNRMFLDFSVKEIFSYYKNENCSISHQKANKRTIELILNFINGSPENEEKYGEIKSFFEMGLEDAYELFYKSEEFIKYSEEDKTKELDKEFERERGFSLLETNAFVKAMKMYKKIQKN